MKITKLTAQVKNSDRINVFIDDRFRFGLDISQIVDLGLKVGLEIDENRLAELEIESQFGKLYAQALNYCFIRPRSVREVRDYLWKKSQPKLLKSGKKTAGLPSELTDRVVNRLLEKSYLDDVKFTTWWVENRFIKKGVSRRRLEQDLRRKGVATNIIKQVLDESVRDDQTELQKMLRKKRARYSDDQKLIAYLVRQGFNYDDVRKVVAED
ncbi:MAG: regulatory protein RecX [Candidatus Nanosyncoccaceae bacterium]|jgi:regulatory protein